MLRLVSRRGRYRCSSHTARWGRRGSNSGRYWVREKGRRSGSRRLDRGVLNVDPFLEPSNGPNYFPFDPNVLYEMKVDNNHDGIEDITFQFRFKTETRLPGVFTGFAGGIAGIPPITSLDGPGSAGLSLRQTYTV